MSSAERELERLEAEVDTLWHELQHSTADDVEVQALVRELAELKGRARTLEGKRAELVEQRQHLRTKFDRLSGARRRREPLAVLGGAAIGLALAAAAAVALFEPLAVRALELGEVARPIAGAVLASVATLLGAACARALPPRK